MSDLVEQYANERANERALDAIIAAVSSLMEKGSMALDAAMELLSVPESMAADVRLALGA